MNQVRTILTNVYLITFISIFFATTLKAQVFDIDTLQYNGDSEKLIDLVILADGYTAGELDLFVEDARTMTDYIMSQKPFDSYRNLFNVFVIKVISNESGAKHPGNARDCPEDVPENRGNDPRHFHSKMFIPNGDPDNYFGSSFDSFGMHRLVVATNEAAVHSVLRANTPFYDQAIVLVNSVFYGGSGGRIPTATTHNKSSEIAIHELAHSFANLSDEYWAGGYYAAETANLTRLVRPDEVPWKKWLGHEGIGVYPFGSNAPESVWFRPHEYCKMQILAAPFCAVCTEELVHRFHQVSNPILESFPQTDSKVNIDSVSYFGIHLSRPQPNSLEIKWFLNGDEIAGSLDSIHLDPATLLSGENSLKVTVRDTTTFVRTYEPPVYEAQWTVDHEGNSISELAAPITLWGDTVEICYGYGTAFSIKQPFAGVEYLWYSSETDGTLLGSGEYFTTDRLYNDTMFYIEATSGSLRSTRTPVLVKVLEQTPPPTVLVEKTKDGMIKATISNPDPELQYRWYLNEDARRSISFGDMGAPHYISIVDNGRTLNMRQPMQTFTLYVEAINAQTTCPSSRVKVDLTN